MSDHYAASAALLTPGERWNGRVHEKAPITHEDQRKASIHSNLAKIEAMETANVIEYAKLLTSLGHQIPDSLLIELNARIERTYRNA
jgi:hypothetical protein